MPSVPQSRPVVIIGFVVWYFLLNNSGGGGTPSDSSAPLQSLVQSILPSTS